MAAEQPQQGGQGVHLFSPPAAHFDGETYSPQYDQQRLSAQLQVVWNAMAAEPGRWWSLVELAQRVGMPHRQAGVSARMRDLRKPKFGGHQVLRRRREGAEAKGVHEYKLVPNPNWLEAVERGQERELDDRTHRLERQVARARELFAHLLRDYDQAALGSFLPLPLAQIRLWLEDMEGGT